MRVRSTRPDDERALRPVGGPEDDPVEGLVFVASRGLTDWAAAEEELTEAFTLAQAASTADAPVVFVVESEAMLGRATPLDSMVATGLVSGARALAFEGLRKQRYVGILATDRSEGAGSLVDAVRFAVAARACHGQVLTLGTGHAGAMFP